MQLSCWCLNFILQHTRAVAEPGRTASFIKKVFKRSTSIVDSSKYTAVAIGDPIFRLLRHGQPVPKGERAAATEKLLREELADVIYVPAKFGWALYYAILARTDVFCYFVMILDHIVSGHILTMPLPFFVFLFGMMSKPRPSPRFWSFVIIYIQVGKTPPPTLLVAGCCFAGTLPVFNY